jgi:TM2 domain-containing membrane protein YozV
MNANFVNIIKRIITEQGEDILADPQRLKGYVSDYAAAESKPERLAFGRCIEYGAYTELKNAPNAAARQAVKAAVVQRVYSNAGIDIALCNGAMDVLEAALFGIAPAPVYQAPQPQQAGYSPTSTQPYKQQPQARQQQYQQPQYQYQQPQYYSAPQAPVNSKDKGIAILLYVFLGEFGAHYFYVSNVSRGLICFVYNIVLGILSITTGGIGAIAWLIIWIVGLVQLCNWQAWLTKHSK